MITAQAQPEVESGHVGAWIGVGGPGLGPGGSNEWIQAGLAAFPGGRTEVYYEVALPNAPARYTRVANAAAGTPYRLAVVEVAGRPGSWQVLLGGLPASPPVQLPGSDGAWRPVATAESWDGDRPACNRFAYAFDGVVFTPATGGSARALASHRLLAAPGYEVEPRGEDSFVAHAV